ncbi:MAG: hypothetical protein SV375_15855, partial [Thermodesulfobacteriota bacterium]|nr:hypothetical protein [Thermodesulfobacteriota bacterium]
MRRGIFEEKKAINLMTLAGPVDGLRKQTRGFFTSGAVSFSIKTPPKNQSRSYRDRKEVNRLNKHRLETTDIFRGAFFLCNGGDLS